MYGIGQFAQLAQVSVRTLHHYHDIGLLSPAAIDPQTGYRSYGASQLRRINWILALKDLGFGLGEIAQMGDADVDAMVELLRKRQADVEQRVETERRRLSRVAARLSILQGEDSMSDHDTSVVIKQLAPVRVATCRADVDGFDDDFGPVFAELYPQLFAALGQAGVTPAGPTYGLYEHREDGRLDVIAGIVIAGDASVETDTVTTVDLPAAERAATIVHLGAMDRITTSYGVLDGWIQAAGEQAVGLSREVYLDCPENQDDWVTELQFVLA